MKYLLFSIFLLGRHKDDCVLYREYKCIQTDDNFKVIHEAVEMIKNCKIYNTFVSYVSHQRI